jgi:hypothetical protein
MNKPCQTGVFWMPDGDRELHHGSSLVHAARENFQKKNLVRLEKSIFSPVLELIRGFEWKMFLSKMNA